MEDEGRVSVSPRLTEGETEARMLDSLLLPGRPPEAGSPLVTARWAEVAGGKGEGV